MGHTHASVNSVCIFSIWIFMGMVHLLLIMEIFAFLTYTLGNKICRK